MKKLEKLLCKVNFKKVFIIYLIAAIVAGIASIAVLGIVFQDKIGFMIDYDRISEKLDDNADAAAIQSDLLDFAKKNADVVDVLILDKDNKILFSAKNSEIAKSGSLNLERDTQWENNRKFMFDPANPQVMYRLIKNERLPRSVTAVFKGFDSHEKYDDEYFFGANSSKTVYSLSYVRGAHGAQKNDSNKTYFIFDISPVVNSIIYVKAVAATAMLFFMLYWVLLALYVYADAAKSKLNGSAWGALTLFTNLGGLIIYKIFKQSGKTCFKCKALQGKTNLYCTECGTKIGESCGKCGGLIAEQNKYCKGCGEENQN